MPHKKDESFLHLGVINFVRKFLYTAGTPLFFALQILAWTVLWLADQFLQIARAILFIIFGILETIIWFGELLTNFFSGKFLPVFHKLLHPPKVIYRHRGKIAEKIFSSAATLRDGFTQIIPAFRQQFRLRLSFLSAFRLPTLSLTHLTLPRRRPAPVRFRKTKPGRPALFSRSFLLVLLGFAFCFFLLFLPFWIISTLGKLPDPRLLAVRDIPLSTKIYDRNGDLLYQIYADENRTLVSLDTLPPYVAQATVAIEDKNFYHHPGFDPQGIIRAALANTNGESVQGGSTITQQLVKTVFLTPEKTLERKIKEIILSFWAERLFSKKQILTMYLNQVAYGGAAYGIEEGARTYFGKPAHDLSLPEAALLAGLPSAPSAYSPFGAHPEMAKTRQRQVLAAMREQGYITPEEAVTAEQTELRFARQATLIKAPHFVMYVKDYLVKKYGIRAMERGGLEVTTSLDYPTYEAVAKMLKDGVEAQRGLNVGNGAALVTKPKTGEILAMVGSIDFFNLAHDGNVNVTIAPRSPGSSIKPLNYALALEKGILTPSTIISDSPVIYRTAGAPDYIPVNYDNRFHGQVTARVALASSYNIPAVKVLEKNGLRNFLDFARKMGITTWTDPSRFGLALTLGGGEVTMVDMANAYSAFANGGSKVNLNPVLLVKDYRGQILEDNRSYTKSEQVISAPTAFLIANILADDAARIPTFGPGSALNIAKHTVSVKTGTTQDKRDNWTIGFTPTYLAAVWVGNNDNSPMSPYLESGNTGAAAIWNPIMTYLLKDLPDEPIAKPEGVVAVQICAYNGLLPCENCPSLRTEYFIKGTEPKRACKISPEEAQKQREEAEK